MSRDRRTVRRTHRPLLAAGVAVALALALVGGPTSGAPGEPSAVVAPQPLHAEQTFGDPAVERTRTGYVAVATGPLVRRASSRNGRRWKVLPPALERLPAWAARNRGDVWAPDLVRLRGRWVLYFSAPVKGLTSTGRCIGVATARTATGTFVPDDRAPLVCPPKGRTPTAGNQVPDRVGLPRHGVIDPSVHVDEDGWPHLLYKTDGVPSTIRVLPLRRNGLAPRAGRASRELLRSSGVVENPVLLRRAGALHLLASEGDYARCTYRTTRRTAASLDELASAPVEVLLQRRGTGLCGPGGADLTVVGSKVWLHLHAWACARGTRPCGKQFTAAQARERRAVRALYAVRLRFADGVPTLGRWRG